MIHLFFVRQAPSQTYDYGSIAVYSTRMLVLCAFYAAFEFLFGLHGAGSIQPHASAEKFFF